MAYLTCAKIAADIAGFACNAGPVGILPEAILINFEDIESVTAVGNVVSGITLAAGKYGYKYESAKNAFEASAALAAGTYVNKFTHQLVFRILLKNQTIKDELDKMANAKIVAIVKNVDKTTDEVRYEILGLEAGLDMSDLQSNSTDSDGVFYTGTLSTSDNAKESSLPKSFFKTDLETTESAIEALLTPPTP